MIHTGMKVACIEEKHMTRVGFTTSFALVYI